MFFGFEKVQKFIKTGFTKLLNKKLSKNYKDDTQKAEKIKFYSYYEFYLHKIIALYEYQLHLIAGVDKDEPNFEKLQNECKYYDNLCGSIDLKSVPDAIKLACINEPKFQELMKSINYYNSLIKHFVNHYNSENYAQNLEYWEDFYYERLCEYCENSAKYCSNGVDDIRREIIEFANRELEISVRDGVLNSNCRRERQDDQEILPPHQVRGQNDKFDDLHDAPLGCHPERSEGSQNDQEILRFAQHDKKQSQHDKNVDNTSSYVQDHPVCFAATPPREGNYNFPYLSNVYNGNRHSCEGRNLDNKVGSMPAYIGMTATPIETASNDNGLSDIIQNNNIRKTTPRLWRTPPREGNYAFPYLSDIYSEFFNYHLQIGCYAIGWAACANDNDKVLRYVLRQAQHTTENDNFNRVFKRTA